MIRDLMSRGLIVKNYSSPVKLKRNKAVVQEM
jgi:hypothetical protein